MNKEELKENITEFLIEMSNQDNRATRFPYYYVVMSDYKEYEECFNGEYVLDENSEGMVLVEDFIKQAWEDDRFGVLEDETVDQILEELTDISTQYRITEILEDLLSTPRRFTMEYKPRRYGVFLTEKDAENHIRINGHNLGANPRTYVDCMYRATYTENFLTNLFNYFEVPLPPEGYHSKKDVLN